MAIKINKVKILSFTVQPRTKRDELLFTLLSAHMNGFTSASLEQFQPFQNQNLLVLVDWKYIELCGEGRWKLTEDGLEHLKLKYKSLFNTSEFRT